MNDQRKFQDDQMSEDTRQIRDHGKSVMDKDQIRDQGGFNDARGGMENPGDYNEDKELEAKWQKIRDPFRREYSSLTDADLSYREGEFGLMLGRIGSKTGMSPSQLRHRILTWD